MELTPASLSQQEMYKILTATVVPRPIGWVSSVDKAGRLNLAPFSFFNVVCPKPPHVLFCPSIRGIDQSPKDTLHNVRETGEFVVNLVTESLAEAMNATSVDAPAEVNEFELAGLTAQPSVVVRPPRVAESPVSFECQVVHIYDVGDTAGAGSVVIGKIVHMHIADNLLLANYRINLEALQPIGRLIGTQYCRTTDVFEMTRPAPTIST